MSNFNIEDFRVTGPITLSRPRKLPRRLKRGQLFIPGPIPVAVLILLRASPALKVWLALHTRQRMRRSPTLAKTFMKVFGLSKRQAQRGLAELEVRDLVRVAHGKGRAAAIELLMPPDPGHDDHGV